MPHASLASLSCPALAWPDLRRTLAITLHAAQVLGLATTLWLILAGPGLLADGPSTVPVQAIQ